MTRANLDEDFGSLDVPWLHRGAIDELATILKPDFTVLEFGAGGSTAWIARRVKQVVSIEHSLSWYRKVAARLAELGLTNVELVYIARGDAAASLVSSRITQFPDGHFDLVFVDGGDRNRAIAKVIDKVKLGGWLVLDDTHRSDYDPSKRLLAGWKRRDIRGACRGRKRGQAGMKVTTFYERLK